MRNLFLLITFCLIIASAKSQITQIGTVPNYYLEVYHFKNAGDKLVDENNETDSLIMYNFDGTVYKVIDIPHPNVTYSFYHIYGLSENLFDTDSNTFEYIQNIINSSGPSYVRIYREDGTLLFSKDSVSWVGPIDLNKDGIPVMRLQNKDMPPYFTSLYTLPGKIDCIPTCSGDGNVTGSDEEDLVNSSGNMNLSSFPNPARFATKVFYQMPQGVSFGTLIFYDLQGNEVKQFTVSNLFEYILVSTDNLPTGTYVYRIETSLGRSEGKQQIVIR